MTWRIYRRDQLERLDDLDRLKLDLTHGLFTIFVISATVLWVTGLLRWSPANWIGFAMLMFLIDFKPVAAVPRYCWEIFPPMRMTNRVFRVATRFLRALLLFFVILGLGYLILVLPHAFILAQVAYITQISAGILILYTFVITFCLLKIVRGNST